MRKGRIGLSAKLNHLTSDHLLLLLLLWSLILKLIVEGFHLRPITRTIKTQNLFKTQKKTSSIIGLHMMSTSSKNWNIHTRETEGKCMH